MDWLRFVCPCPVAPGRRRLRGKRKGNGEVWSRVRGGCRWRTEGCRLKVVECMGGRLCRWGRGRTLMKATFAPLLFLAPSPSPGFGWSGDGDSSKLLPTQVSCESASVSLFEWSPHLQVQSPPPPCWIRRWHWCCCSGRRTARRSNLQTGSGQRLCRLRTRQSEGREFSDEIREISVTM